MRDFIDFSQKFKSKFGKFPYVFLSGAISERMDTYKKYFNDAEEILRGLGVEKVFNPSVIDMDTPWEKAMEITLGALEDVDCLYVLKDYENSRGTKMEIDTAKALGIPVFYE